VRQNGKWGSAHGYAQPDTPAIAVATLATSSSLAGYLYRPDTSKLQKIRPSTMMASGGAWVREPTSMAKLRHMPLPLQHVAPRHALLGDARPPPLSKAAQARVAAAGSSPRFAGWNDVSAWQGNATARSVTIAGGWPMMSGGSRVGTAQTVGSSRVTTAQTERTRGPSARRAHRVEKL
jgi:hypothetical protein